MWSASNLCQWMGIFDFLCFLHCETLVKRLLIDSQKFWPKTLQQFLSIAWKVCLVWQPSTDSQPIDSPFNYQPHESYSKALRMHVKTNIRTTTDAILMREVTKSLNPLHIMSFSLCGFNRSTLSVLSWKLKLSVDKNACLVSWLSYYILPIPDCSVVSELFFWHHPCWW